MCNTNARVRPPVIVEECTAVLVWLTITLIYTTILTVTALSVIYILRKRRSSILKNQRPPRTPFCELEFNVCTPTDSAKSRRVSFSKRTGVAEFATNEATTTWKNFYEEHNKSLESSGNDSELNHGKQTVAQLGKRIFDQQFEEVEVVDFMGSLNPGLNISSSISNINFAQQKECTDTKLTVPQNNFELSAFTEQQSKLFGDDLTNNRLGEVSDSIKVNFSEIQQISQRDDLDEIQDDLQRHNNVVCRGPFDKDLSEYIEVDLNMTHVALKNDESDMSITETVHSPKVQDVSKSCSIEKNIRITDDWVADKENIVVNPYVAQRESLNFAVNDDILIFDGKKLIVQTEKSTNEISQKHLPDPIDRAPQRKTIVLNCNDDLPNFIENTQGVKHSFGFIGVQPSLSGTQSKLKTTPCNYGQNIIPTNISMPQNVPNVIPNAEEQKTVLFENDTGNISITQAVPAKIINKEKRRTIVYENDTGNISITQALPTNILLSSEGKEKRKTIIFENESCNISMTQSVPANIISESTAVKNRTIILNDGITNLCITQLIKNPVKKDTKETRRTVVYEDTTGNISVTQLTTSTKNLDNHVLVPEQNKTIILESDTADISVTQVLPTNIILHNNRDAKSHENDADVSMTQALPTNILLGDNLESNRRETVLSENKTGNISINQGLTKLDVATNKVQQKLSKDVSTNYDKTVVFDKYTEDLSITQAVRLNEVLLGVTDKQNEILSNNTLQDKTGTFFQNNAAEISMTQAVHMNRVIGKINEQKQNESNEIESNNAYFHKEYPKNKRNTIDFENDDADISITQAVPVNQVIDIINQQKQNEINYNESTNACFHKDDSNKRRTIVFENGDADISMTQAVPLNQVIDMIKQQKQNEINYNELTNSCFLKDDSNKRRTIVFENDNADISMTQAVPMNQVMDMINEKKQNEINDIETCDAFIDKEIQNNKRTTTVLENHTADTSMSQVARINQTIEMINEDKINENDDEKINAILNNENIIKKRRTTLLVHDVADISVIQSDSLNHVSIARNNKDEHNDTCTEHNNPMGNRKQTIAFNKDKGDKSMLEASSENWDSSDQIAKKKTIVLDNAKSIENIDLLLKLTDGLEENENSVKLGENEVNCVAMTETNDPERSRRKTITYEQSKDMSITDAIFGNCDLKPIQAETRFEFNKTINDATSPPQPKPAGMSTYHLDTFKISHCKDENKDSTKYYMLENLTNVAADVAVYQAVTSDRKKAKTRKRDSTNHVAILNEDSELTSNEITPIMERTSHNLAEISLEIKIPKNEENDEQTGLISKHNEHHLVDITPKTGNTEILNDKSENSILNDLLDMTHSSIIGKISENIPPNKVSAAHTSLLNTETAEESDKKVLKEESTNPHKRETPKNHEKSSIHIEFSNEERTETDEDPHKPKSKLKCVLKRSHSPQPEYEKNLSSNLASLDSLEMCGRKSSKSIKMANNTNELLDMISEFTDKSRNIDPHLEENDSIREHVVVEGFMALEHKDTAPESKQSNLPPKRQSIALSREDLLNNISMAGAALQRSRYELDESDHLENTAVETPEQDIPQRKTIRLNADAVKTLHFEDECSLSDKSESNQTSETPLKKIAFEENSHTKELKTKVIPDFSNIPDGIKELMDDLVKPMADVLPYATTTLDKIMKDCPSTCSIQIQANKLTSSQVDVQCEPYTNLESACEDLKNLSSSDDLNRSTSRAVKRPVLVSSKSSPTPAHTHAEKSLEIDEPNESVCRTIRSKSDDAHSSYSSGRVVIFDHNNPLNNVFIAPPQAMEIHRYSPIKPVESITESSPCAKNSVTETTAESKDRAVNQFHTLNAVATNLQHITSNYEHTETTNEDNLSDIINRKHVKESTKFVAPNISSDQYSKENIDDALFQSIITNRLQIAKLNEDVTKCIMLKEQIPEAIKEADPSNTSIDLVPESEKKRDIDVNTDIVMKGNKELLEASSSLTLVDDTLNRHKFDWNADISASEQNQSGLKPPPFQTIYKLEEQSEDKFDSDLTSYEEKTEKSLKKKRVSISKQKREKQCSLSSLDVTPKPAAKIRKRSTNATFCYEKPTRLVIDLEKDQKSPKKIKNKTPTINCQQMPNVKPNNRNNVVQNVIDKEKEVQSKTDTSSTAGSPISSNISKVTSFTRSDDLGDQIVVQSYSKLTSSLSSKECLTDSSLSVMSSKVQVAECDSHLDIMSKINSLPSMGTNDCEWESSKGDKWSFLLLHSWLRLSIRFEECTRVDADTPIANVLLESLHQDKKSSIAVLCIFFASETMRYCISRRCETAKDLPRLMQRLSNVAKFAANWARAMHDSRARLAYTLTDDGYLTLKVANTFLHTVWEVTMKLELVVDDEQTMPWPSACAVRVSNVLEDGAPSSEDIHTLLQNTPRDWGHAPRTIWKIFRYLKHLKVKIEPNIDQQKST